MPKQVKRKKPEEKNLSSENKNVSYGDDNPQDEFGKWIMERIQLLLKVYGTGKISTYIHYMKSDMRGQNVSVDMVFSVVSNSVYKSLHLQIYPIAKQMFEDKQYSKLMYGLVHEVAHMITDPLDKVANERFTSAKEITEANEQATETIAQLCKEYLLLIKPGLFK